MWERELDIYGKVRKETQESANFVPFRYQGQYYDSEVDLCYNRFRYYDCNIGTYISQDPIGLLGGLSFYAYVHDVNGWVDVFGLSKYTPIEVLGRKVFQNSTSFDIGIPKYVDSKVHPSIKAKIEAGYTNLDLMKLGKAPIGVDGKPINLHHLIGEEPGTLVELLQSFHQKYNKQLHGLIEKGNSFRNSKELAKNFNNFRKKY